MFGIYRGWRAPQKLVVLGLLLTSLIWGWALPALALPFLSGSTAKKIVEASPPEVIQELRQALEKYQPQVTIVSPKANVVLPDDTVTVQFQVKDLPLFKAAKLGLGPHLHVFLDDQPYQAVYNASQPLVLKNLTPGTHTIRAFASRPWHESFKNEGAYAQTTFHVFTKTPTQNPDPNLPLLTYSRPQGSYGAEPIMLDFYLTNAPLHLVAQEDQADEFPDWRIQVTVNGDRFVLDQWQPLYLKGFKPGKNWVQIAYIDEQGNPLANVYNNTARLVTYEPGGQDTLSQLVRGELTAAQAMDLVDPNYVPSPVAESAPPSSAPPEPAAGEVPSASLPPSVTPPIAADQPAPVAKPQSEPPSPPTAPVALESVPAQPELPAADPTMPADAVPPTATVPVKTFAEQAKEKAGGLFDRLRKVLPRPQAVPETVPGSGSIETPNEAKPVEVVPLPPLSNEAPTVVPAAPAPPAGNFFDRFRRSSPPPAAPINPDVEGAELEGSAPSPASNPAVPSAAETIPSAAPNASGLPVAEPPANSLDQAVEKFFDQFESPSPAPASPVNPGPEGAPADSAGPAAADQPAIAPRSAEPMSQTSFDRLRRSPLNSPAPDQPATSLPRVAPTNPATAPAWMFPQTPPPPAFTDPAAAETKLYRVPPPRSQPMPPASLRLEMKPLEAEATAPTEGQEPPGTEVKAEGA